MQDALHAPGYAGFTQSFVLRSAGQFVTFCGTDARSGDGNGQHFLSVFGRVADTRLETQDPSFPVLWSRVCTRTAGAW